MTLYVVVSSLFIYSTVLVSDIVSKTGLGLSPKPVWMVSDRTPLLSPPLLTFSVIHSPSPTHSRTHSVRDTTIKNAPLLAEHDSPIPVKNDGWTGCVGRVNCFVYMEGQ